MLLGALALLAQSSGLVVLQPANIAGTFFHAPSAIGPELPAEMQGIVLRASPQNGCLPASNANFIKGNIVVVFRGGCDFAAKLRSLQAAGAAAVIVANHEGNKNLDDEKDLITMTALDDAEDIQIPSLFVTRFAGEKLIAVLDAQQNRPHVVINATGLADNEDDEKRAKLLQTLPGMRELVSPFRRLSGTFDNTQHDVGPNYSGQELPTRREVLSVVINRKVYETLARDGAGVVSDSHAGLYEPGRTCTSLHGPTCRQVRAKFESAPGYQIFAPPNTNLENNKVIDSVAAEHTRALLGDTLFRSVQVGAHACACASHVGSVLSTALPNP
jgi:hypothetical protein